jgi:YbgC/YbaW family acyl-CoA thioester hydrolase
MTADTPTLETWEDVMFFDTDAGGVVHNIAYLRFIETCRTRLAAIIGMDLPRMMAMQQFPVVIRTEIDYLRPAKFGEALTIRGWLARLERARFWCRFEVRRDGEEPVLVSCRQALALVQLPAGIPLRLPIAWRAQWPHLFRRAE